MTATELESPHPRDEAERLLSRLGDALDSMAHGYEQVKILVPQIYKAQAWKEVGYGTWEECVEARFAMQLGRLSRTQRKELTAELRQEGMSTRAIAAVVGADQSTVIRDLSATDADASVGEKVLSVDGRARPATKPKPAKGEVVSKPTKDKEMNQEKSVYAPMTEEERANIVRSKLDQPGAHRLNMASKPGPFDVEGTVNRAKSFAWFLDTALEAPTFQALTREQVEQIRSAVAELGKAVSKFNSKTKEKKIA